MTNKEKLHAILDKCVLEVNPHHWPNGRRMIIEFHNYKPGGIAGFDDDWLLTLMIYPESEQYMVVSNGIWQYQMTDYSEEDIAQYYLNKYQFLRTWQRLSE